jgi:hypothetical protein
MNANVNTNGMLNVNHGVLSGEVQNERGKGARGAAIGSDGYDDNDGRGDCFT